MKFVHFLIIILCSSNILSSQSLNTNQHNAISSGGARLENNQTGLSVDWVVGELMTETIQNENESFQISQGFLQPFIKIVSSNQTESQELKLRLFPNPTAYQIHIISEYDSKLSVDVYSIDGHEILVNHQFNRKTILPIEHIPDGTYLLKIHDPLKKTSSVYRIQKLAH